MSSYDRYTQFRQDGNIAIVPFGEIPNKDTDAYEKYTYGESRLDNISYKYYNDSSYGWLIMQANPEYGSMEFEIPNGVFLRIPLPLSETIADYRNSIDKYNKLNKE